MRRIYLIIAIAALSACNSSQKQQQESTSAGTSKIQEGPVLEADDATKKFLVDMTNASWYTAKLANAATFKSHDQSIIQSAQLIRKRYTLVKDKIKIVSIPYQVEVPYFLTKDQNDSVRLLQSTDSLSFNKTFIAMVQRNDAVILSKCDDFEATGNHPEDMQKLIDYCRKTVKDNPLNSKP